jgi:hypothetical protein
VRRIVPDVDGPDARARARSVRRRRARRHAQRRVAVEYDLEVTGQLAVARLGEPGRGNRVPVEIIRRGQLPYLELLAIGAYFNPSDP